MKHLAVLAADTLGRIDPVQEIVEVLRAQQDLDRAAARPVHVEGPQPGLDPRLRHAEALPGDAQALRVELKIAVDLAQLLSRAVEALRARSSWS